MKLNRLILIPIFVTALSSCGSGPVKITGVASTVYTKKEDKREELEPTDYIKLDDKQYPRYIVDNYQTFSIKVSPVWTGSRVPAFNGNVATFSVSKYWKIVYDEESSPSNNPFYDITFEYPENTDIDDLMLKYSVNGFASLIYFKLSAYSSLA